MTKRIVYIDEASDILGLSREAIRKRIKRGSIKAKKDADGRWQVIIEDTDQDTTTGHGQATKDAYIRSLEERVSELKQERDYLRQDVEYFKVLTMQKERKILQLEDGRQKRFKWWPFGKKDKE